MSSKFDIWQRIRTWSWLTMYLQNKNEFKRLKKSKYKPHQGKKECMRRKKQIDNNLLNASTMRYSKPRRLKRRKIAGILIDQI